jgi:hypothetical protein
MEYILHLSELNQRDKDQTMDSLLNQIVVVVQKSKCYSK